MWLKITNNYSPNFSLPKRSKKKIKFLIIHYTGMKSLQSAYSRLNSTSSDVSAHYLISRSGKIYNLLCLKLKAWHAGKSQWKNDKNINCLLLPGSRDGEVKYILPEFISLIKNSNVKLRNVNWIIPTTELKYNYIISKIKKYNVSGNTRVVVLEENYELLKQADLAVACSGTITLELALFKVPTIAVYKTDFFSAFIGRLLVNFQNVILPNFLLSKNIIPFLFQEKFNNIRITKLLIDYIKTIDKKKKEFKKYSSMILKNMIYDQPKRINFSINSSKEINKIINNYDY